jgi:hypothetical protein
MGNQGHKVGKKLPHRVIEWGSGSENQVHTVMSNVNSPQSLQNCRSHPLMHTPPIFAQVQNVEKKKAEPKTTHFLRLDQDIVPRP